jgi:hypothetical protein
MPKKVDANHGDIRDAGRQIPGTWTHDTHDLGHGFPDLLHASRYGVTVIGNVPLDEILSRLKGLPVLVLKGFNLPVEVKSAKGKLTRDEKAWFDRWPGPAVVVRDPDEMLKWTGAVEEALQVIDDA